jgi:sortase A
MKKSKKGVPLIILGVLLIISALAYTGYNYYVTYRAGKISQSIVEQIDKKTDSGSDYEINEKMEMPVIEIDGNYYVGIIEIPSLDLKLPVMSSWSYANLSISPCRFSGSIYSSDMVIAGHNYITHFGKLRNLNIGDEVKFTDSDGNEFIYEVKDLEILPPTAVEEMTDSGWELTLFTCTVGAKTRLAVRCSSLSNAS